MNLCFAVRASFSTRQQSAKTLAPLYRALLGSSSSPYGLISFTFIRLFFYFAKIRLHIRLIGSLINGKTNDWNWQTKQELELYFFGNPIYFKYNLNIMLDS